MEEVEKSFLCFGDEAPFKAFETKKLLEREVERATKDLDDFAKKERPASVVDPLFVGIRLTEPLAVQGLDPTKEEEDEENKDKAGEDGLENEADSSVLVARLDQMLKEMEEEKKQSTAPPDTGKKWKKR